MSDEYKKYIIISGGAGGLGRAAALYFSERGYTVFSLDIKKNGNSNENITEIQTDITSAESIERALEKVKNVTEKLDAVISLAGIYLMDSMVEIPEAELKKIFDVNFFGVYRLNRAFLPLVINGNGRIIVTTSELAGMKALPFNGIYSLTKTALQHYTDSLRQELALLGIPVIEIMPGAFDTGMITASFDSLDKMNEKTLYYNTDIKRFRQVMQTQSGGAKPPVLLAKTIYKAVVRRKPRLRYKPNNNLLLKIFNVFPRRTQVFLIKTLLKH